MFDRDLWLEIFDTMAKNKLRTFLTAFGVSWGIFMLVLLLGAGKGMENGIRREFAGEAMNSVWFWQGKTELAYKGMPPGRQIRFTNEDVKEIQRQIGDDIDLLARRNGLWGEYTINRKDKNGSYRVMGADGDLFLINGEKLNAGRALNYKDIVEKRKVIYIGEKVKNTLFEEGEDAVGKLVLIKGVYFRVVGVFNNSQNNGRNEERAFVPISTLQTAFNQPRQVHVMALTPVSGKPAAEVEQKVRKIMAQRHSFDTKDPRALGVSNNEEQFEKFNNLFKGIAAFVWIIGIMTLIAGIVGVSNIMMIIVKERTKEIGVRKALGATPNSIIQLILTEAVFITALSGYLGLIVGVGVLDGLRALIESMGSVSYFDRPETDFGVAVSAIIILVVSGAFAGLIPAMKAARVKPIEALNAD